jgi:hypothetical protein
VIWLAFLITAGIIVVLGHLFLLSARAIRQDIDRRFDQVQAQLKEEADSILGDLPDDRDDR